MCLGNVTFFRNSLTHNAKLSGAMTFIDNCFVETKSRVDMSKGHCANIRNCVGKLN